MPSPAPMRARRAWPIALGAVLAALVAPAAAPAAPGWTASQPIPQSLSDGAPFGPAEVEVDRAGNAHAIWVELAFPDMVVKTAFKPAGSGWSAPTPLVAEASPGVPAPGMFPTLTVAPDGTATAVWQDYGLLSPSTGIWASTRPANGDWGPPANLSAGAPAPFGSAGPRAVTDADGNTTVVWQAGLDVRAATRPAGGAWGPPVDVYTGADGDTNNLYGLSADVAVGGAVTVVFRVGLTSDFGLYAKTRPALGAAWGPIETLIGRGNAVGDPQLAISRAGSSTGEATALWHDDSTGGLKVSTRPPNGSWDVPVDVGAGSSASNQKLVYDRHGNAVAAWQDSAGIQVMRRTAGAWSAATALPGAEGGSVPQLAAGPRAEIDVAWSASDGSTTRVYAARRSNGAWSTPVPVSDAGAEAGAPGLATGPTGDAETVWAVDTLRAATYRDVPELGTDWTANGLLGSFDLRSWIRYLGGNAGVELTGGATRPDVNDPNSIRLAHSDAWVQQETGETVVATTGQVRFAHPAHYIDNRVVDPQLRIAPDGLTGRVVADGQGSGEMADALNGNWKVVPYQDVHLLDLDVDAGTKVLSADGTRTTWVGVPAYITAAGAPYLSYEAGTRYGFFTITAPASLPTRSAPPADPGPQPGPKPGPKGVDPKPKPAPLRVTGRVVRTGRRGAVTLRLDKRPGAKAGKAYRVRIARKRRTVATGTVRGRTLKLSVRKVGHGKRARYPKLRGVYVLTGGKGVKRTRLTVRRPA